MTSFSKIIIKITSHGVGLPIYSKILMHECTMLDIVTVYFQSESAAFNRVRTCRVRGVQLAAWVAFSISAATPMIAMRRKCKISFSSSPLKLPQKSPR